MLRRDYILRMIEEFIRALARINQQKKEQLWREAGLSLEEQVTQLTGNDLSTVATLTDTELLAALLRSGEFQAHAEKSFMLARLLIEAAEVADAENREVASYALRLKGLHLLLHTALRGEVSEWPEFAPNIDLILQRLNRVSLPIHTQALLMQFFERTGQFARAEDALHTMLELLPANPPLHQLGISFYQRMLAQSDTALEAGNLPRPEVQTGLDGLHDHPVI